MASIDEWIVLDNTASVILANPRDNFFKKQAYSRFYADIAGKFSSS